MARFHILLCAASALTMFVHDARAETRVAFSQKLGVEILAASPNWCAERVSFRIVAADRRVFTQPDFTALIQRLGQSLVAKACPAAKMEELSGTDQAGAIAWRGTAMAVDQWVLQAPSATQQQATNLDPQQQAVSGSQPAVAEGPPKPSSEPIPSLPAVAAVPPPPFPSSSSPAEVGTMPQAVAASISPLIGDWRAEMKGPQGSSTLIVSVYEAKEFSASAYVEFEAKNPANMGKQRIQVTGSFDAPSGQFDMVRKEILRLTTPTWNWTHITGALDTARRTMRVNANWVFGPGEVELRKADDRPRIAEQVQKTLAQRAAWLAESRAAPKAWRLVGTMPPGRLRQPTCEEVLTWASSVPLDLQIDIIAGFSGGTIPRQYDDVHSAAVFGTPAYYWSGMPLPGAMLGSVVTPGSLVNRSCPSDSPLQRDPRMGIVRTLIGRSNFTLLMLRRQRDDLMDLLPVLAATSGGTPAEDYADLAQLADAATVGEEVARLATSLHLPTMEVVRHTDSLGKTDKQEIIGDAQRLRAEIAAQASAEVRAQLASLPESQESLARASTLATDFAAAFTTDAQPIAQAAAERRRQIGQTIVQSAVTEIKASPKTLDGLTAAQERAASTSQLVVQDLPDARATLDAAFAELRASSASAISEAEIASLKSAPATPEGARVISARRDEVKRLIGFDSPPGISYEQAADARLAEVGKAVEPDLNARLAALAPPSWDTVRQARQIARDAAAPFGSTPIAVEIAGLGNARAKALVAALADQIVAAIGAQTATSASQVVRVYASEQKAAPSDTDKDWSGDADRIRQAARQKGDALAASVLPSYRDEIGKIPPSHAAAFRLARAAILFQRVSKIAPGFVPYGEATKEAALSAQAEACPGAAQRLGISRSQTTLPLVVGSETQTLGALACALSDLGVRQGSFDAPGMFSSSDDYVLTFFVPEDGLARRPVAALDLGVNNQQRLERAFDFRDLAAPDPAAAAGQIDGAPHKIVLRKMSVNGASDTALVGVESDSGGRVEPMSFEQWQMESKQMVNSAALPMSPPSECAAYAAHPEEQKLDVAARAFLSCPAKQVP